MRYSSDVLPNAGKIPCCKLIQRAKTAMDSVCELLTTSRPHFVLCLKPSKVNYSSAISIALLFQF